METIAISLFKARCLGVLAEVKRTGKPILVTRFGVPIAEVVPARPKPKRRKLGGMAGTVEFLGDIVSPVGDPNDWEAISNPERVLDPRKFDRKRKRRR
jgi:prevent-host-death family protein